VFISEALDESHELDAFDSGTPRLDDWLRRFARQTDAKRQGRTYVWHDGNFVVIAYFTVAPHVIQRVELPGRLARGDLDQIPALLLARLAIDRRLQGQGLGTELLIDALSRAVAASDRVGGRSIVVDAIDEAAGRFYEHHGFLRCHTERLRRYARKVSDIASSLG